MKLAVDPWDPSYGTSVDSGDLGLDGTPVAVIDVDIELALDDWRPLTPIPSVARPASVVFVDGVRRVDARVWLSGDRPDGRREAEAGICATWAAGAVRCNGTATVAAIEVGRGLFSASRHARDLITGHGTYEAVAAGATSPEALSLALQTRMGAAERSVANRAQAEDPESLLVVDGPLRGSDHLPGTVGLIKTHHVAYLRGTALEVLAALAPGERTPVFTIGTSWSRHSWYVRLPGPPTAAPLAGVVRCECAANLPAAQVTTLADLTAALLPKFASRAHKDTRAPQNLYPIGGLERQLRRRLGDAALLYRALVRAAA